MTLHPNFIGCDVSKDTLDLFDPESGRYRRVANQLEALQDFAASLEPGRDIVVLEATGHHDRLLRHALAARGIGYVRLNPVTARRFAEARGRLAKTDRIDARSLADFGATFRPQPDIPPCAQRERLAALARRRDSWSRSGRASSGIAPRHLCPRSPPTSTLRSPPSMPASRNSKPPFAGKSRQAMSSPGGPTS